MYERKRKGKKIIVVMASQRRAMKELGRVTFSPDTTEIEKIMKREQNQRLSVADFDIVT